MDYIPENVQVVKIGLKVKIIQKIGVYEEMFNNGLFEDLKTGTHFVTTCFLVKPMDENPEINLDKTSRDYRWIDHIEEDLLLYVKTVLKDAKIF